MPTMCPYAANSSISAWRAVRFRSRFTGSHVLDCSTSSQIITVRLAPAPARVVTANIASEQPTAYAPCCGGPPAWYWERLAQSGVTLPMLSGSYPELKYTARTPLARSHSAFGLGLTENAWRLLAPMAAKSAPAAGPWPGHGG